MRLEDKSELTEEQRNMRFNSKLVRLEGWIFHLSLIEFAFQFQIGAIRSLVMTKVLSFTFKSFNSKLVRLEGMSVIAFGELFRSFNSKLVRLEGYPKRIYIL